MTAWSLYEPHLWHTAWLSLSSPHLGQAMVGVGFTAKCERLESLLDFVVFCLGTAIIILRYFIRSVLQFSLHLGLIGSAIMQYWRKASVKI